MRVYRLCDDCFDSGPRSFARSPLSSSLSLRPSLISPFVNSEWKGMGRASKQVVYVVD